MDIIIILLSVLAVGLAAGLVTVWTRMKTRLVEANARGESERQRAEDAREAAKESVEAERRESRQRIEELRGEHERRLGEERRQWQESFEKQTALAREQMRSQFEKEMAERTATLKEQNREQMATIVEPMRKELERLQQLMSMNSRDHTRHMTELKDGLKAVMEHDKERDRTTQQLASALRNRGKVQGDWGEQVLENILQDSGLREGEEYRKQFAFTSEDGQQLRPDFVVRLQDKTYVVIDSKVSLTAYTDYVGAETEAERQAAAKANLDSLWKHVTELASKNYQQARRAAPYVLMFVPNEGSYVLAMNMDPSLGQRAFRKGVVIINPTNLMVVLNLVHISWQNTRQEENNRKIVEAAQKLYEKFSVFAETFVTLGKQMGTVVRTYQHAQSQLREGPGNLSGRIIGLKDYGISPIKELPKDVEPLDPVE